jgi:hypothetical protein
VRRDNYGVWKPFEFGEFSWVKGELDTEVTDAIPQMHGEKL